MPALSSKTKVALAIAGACVVLIFLWAFLDPFSKFVFLLDTEKEVEIGFNTKIPVSGSIDKNIDVQLPQRFGANVLLNQHLTIPLDETLDVPLNMTVAAPVEADVLVDQILDLNVDVPIDVVLTENELTLDKVQVPLNSDVFIDDTLQIETTLPLDTTVKSVMGVPIPIKASIPIKMSVPIKQTIRVKDDVTVDVKHFRAPLKMVMPIRAQVPVKQKLHIVGTVKVPIEQMLPVHIKKIIGTTLQNAVPVSVAIGNKIPISLKASFDSDVQINGTIPIKLGTLSFKRESVRMKKVD